MPLKSCSYVASVIHAILGLALLCAGLWLFIEVKTLTDLRNAHHYMLDFNVYWPQIIPWMFVLTGFLVVVVSICGVIGTCKSSNRLVFTQIIFVSISIFLAVIVAIVALIFIDTKSSTNFIHDAIQDAFAETKQYPEAAKSFGNIERRFQCCGAQGPREYRTWKDYFPSSCCGLAYDGVSELSSTSCRISDREPNDRHGCIEVATVYASIAVKVISAGSFLVALIGAVVLLSSIGVSRSLRKEPKPSQIVAAKLEMDSKKMLL